MLNLSERITGKGETAGNVQGQQNEKYYVDGVMGRNSAEPHLNLNMRTYLHSDFDNLTLHQIKIHKILMLILNIIFALHAMSTKYILQVHAYVFAISFR